MRNFTLLSLLVLSTFSLVSQVNTKVKILHMLGAQPFQMNSTAQNNLGQDYQVTRLQYYMTRFTVVHDGGQSTAITDDTVALISATDGVSSIIELGMLNITNVEAVKFHIGVHPEVNNLDPLLYPASHPLAPQAPSMHWGWASGYRFLVYEGVGGSNFSQMFQFHGLGNANYFETTVAATGQLYGGELIIALDADYVKGVQDIDVASGIFAHGVDQEDLVALENFRDYVFSQSVQAIETGINQVNSTIDWSVYPNPSTDAVTVSVKSTNKIDFVTITNSIGEEITQSNLNADGTVSMSVLSSGFYFVNLIQNGTIIATKKLVAQ